MCWVLLGFPVFDFMVGLATGIWLTISGGLFAMWFRFDGAFCGLIDLFLVVECYGVFLFVGGRCLFVCFGMRLGWGFCMGFVLSSLVWVVDYFLCLCLRVGL